MRKEVPLCSLSAGAARIPSSLRVSSSPSSVGGIRGSDGCHDVVWVIKWDGWGSYAAG